MMKKPTICVIWGVLGLSFALLLAAEARAGGPWPYTSFDFRYGYVLPFVGLRDRDIPYFAAHPPVYYSHIVARPYGYSPHAYLPGIVTPDFELSSPWHPGQPWQPYWDGQDWRWRARFPGVIGQPEEIEQPAPEAVPSPGPVQPTSIRNPYCPEGAVVEPDSDPRAGGPLRIRNPYVEGATQLIAPGTSPVTRDSQPRVQVVFPVAAAGEP